MDTLTVIAGLCISTAAVAYLAHTDPKRRRVFGLPEFERQRWTKASLAVLLAPGILLLVSGNGAGFTIWLGGLTVIGWGVAATTPARAETWREIAWTRLTRTIRIVVRGRSNLVLAVRRVRAGILFLCDGAERVAALEARIDQLESEVRGNKPTPQRLQAIDAETSGRDAFEVQERLSSREAVGQ